MLSEGLGTEASWRTAVGAMCSQQTSGVLSRATFLVAAETRGPLGQAPNLLFVGAHPKAFTAQAGWFGVAPELEETLGGGCHEAASRFSSSVG